jgi:hypothetical protein
MARPDRSRCGKQLNHSRHAALRAEPSQRAEAFEFTRIAVDQPLNHAPSAALV